MISQTERESGLVGVFAWLSIGSQDRLWWTDLHTLKS
jgi:hypothetical protein